jgi:hypothetical protein
MQMTLPPRLARPAAAVDFLRDGHARAVVAAEWRLGVDGQVILISAPVYFV